MIVGLRLESLLFAVFSDKIAKAKTNALKEMKLKNASLPGSPVKLPIKISHNDL